jgi:hypothetical protein
VRGGTNSPGSLIGADASMLALSSCTVPSAWVWVTQGSDEVGVV